MPGRNGPYAAIPLNTLVSLVKCVERERFMPDLPTISFRCNVCGAARANVPRSMLGREDPSCSGCGSSVRMRGVIHHLSLGLFGTSIPLPDFPIRSDIRGIGLSDWLGYAANLALKLDYTNTFYHTEPFLDIVAVSPDQLGQYDFLISTDVFEHVPPPVFRAFSGSYTLLKPGGLIVLTVPFTDVTQTVEHFPDLDTFKIIELGSDYLLVNRDKKGQLSVRNNLVFHGGPGDTLEMRVFSRNDTLSWLKMAGFVDIQVHAGASPEWGIVPPHHHGLPITARRSK